MGAKKEPAVENGRKVLDFGALDVNARGDADEAHAEAAAKALAEASKPVDDAPPLAPGEPPKPEEKAPPVHAATGRPQRAISLRRGPISSGTTRTGASPITRLCSLTSTARRGSSTASRTNGRGTRP